MKLEKHKWKIMKLLVSFSQNKVTVNAGVLEIHPWQMMPHWRSFSYQLFAGNNTTPFRLNLQGLPGSWGECFLQMLCVGPQLPPVKKTVLNFSYLYHSNLANKKNGTNSSIYPVGQLMCAVFRRRWIGFTITHNFCCGVFRQPCQQLSPVRAWKCTTLHTPNQWIIIYWKVLYCKFQKKDFLLSESTWACY